MKNKSHFEVNIGGRRLTGVWGVLIGLLIAIPVLAVVGVIIFFVLSLAGVVVTLALGVATIAIVIGLLSLLLPKKWREKLGIHINFSHKGKKRSSDREPFIDVKYKEE